MELCWQGDTLFSLPQTLKIISDENAHVIFGIWPRSHSKNWVAMLNKIFFHSHLPIHINKASWMLIFKWEIGTEFILKPSFSSFKLHSFIDTSIGKNYKAPFISFRNVFPIKSLFLCLRVICPSMLHIHVVVINCVLLILGE